MALSKREEAWLARRERLLRLWPWAGAALVALVVGGVAALATWVPLMVNPRAVIERLEAGSLGETTLMTLAALLPVVVLMLAGLLLAIVLLAFVAFANERRLLRLVRRLAGDDESG